LRIKFASFIINKKKIKNKGEIQVIIDNLFFSQSELDKLMVYRYVASKKTGIYRVESISDKFFLNFHQTTRLLKEIDKDIQVMDSECVERITQKNGKFQTFDDLPTIDEYRAFLLNQTISFDFLLKVLTNYEGDFDKYCHEKCTSRSTFSRKMNRITKFAADYQIQFNYNTFSVSGNEMVIRQFYFYLIWVGLRGNIWPFEDEKLEAFLKQNSVYEEKYREFWLTDSNHFAIDYQLPLILAVCYYRYEKGFYIDKNEKMELLFADTTLYHRDFIAVEYFPTREIAEKEMYYWFLISLLIRRDQTLPNEIEKINGIGRIKTSTHPLVVNEKNLMHYLSEIGMISDISEDEKLDFYYKRLLTGMIYAVIGQPFPDAEAFAVNHYSSVHDYALLYRAIEDYYRKNATPFEKNLLKQNAESFITRTTNEVSPYFAKRLNGKKIRVGILMDRNSVLNRGIRQWIANIRYVDMVELSIDDVCHEPVDFIIYSNGRIKEKLPDIPKFNWDMDFARDELEEVHKRLLNLYMELRYDKGNQ
jgi:hypothetical protein